MTFLKKNNYYHLISRGAQEQRLFETEDDCRFFLNLLEKFKSRFLIKILGCCLMPDHVHLIVHCEVSRQLSCFLQDIHQKYTIYFNVKYQRRGKLWQDRFKRIHLETESHARNVLDAIGGLNLATVSPLLYSAQEHSLVYSASPL